MLVFLLPITMGTVGSAASGIMILLLLLSLVYGWSEWRLISTEEKVLCIGMIVFFCAAFLSFLNTDDLAKSWTRLERLVRILAFAPLFLFLRRIKTDLLKPLSFGMIVAGPILLWSALTTGESGRASGAYNAILFGDYAAYVVIFLLTYLVTKNVGWPLKLAALFSLGCAGQATILSETRGAWIAIPIAFLVLSSMYLKSQADSRIKWRTVMISLIALGTIVFIALQDSRIQARSALAISELKSYVDGSNLNTSVGLRLQMWEAAILIWKKNPFIGSGLGDYSTDLKNLIESGESKISSHFGEAHSLFFEFLATTGLLGLGACIFSLFIWPLRLFLQKSKNKFCSKDLFLQSSGAVLIISFALMGLSQNWLGRSSITSVYIVFLAIFLASSRNGKVR